MRLASDRMTTERRRCWLGLHPESSESAHVRRTSLSMVPGPRTYAGGYLFHRRDGRCPFHGSGGKGQTDQLGAQ
jgi:hypothetical protein